MPRSVVSPSDRLVTSLPAHHAVEELRTFVTLSRTHPNDVRERQVVARVDDDPRVTLLFGDSFTGEIRPGAHRLRVHNTLFWKTIAFSVEPGEHLEFVVINSARWWTFGMAGVLGSAPLFLHVHMRSRR